MNIEEYKTELADCLYFGPWSECNPEKALTLIRMAELDLLDPELAELYCCYVHTCFDNSIKYGDQSKDYYEKAILIFDKLIALLDRQGTDDVFRSITGKVETIIKHASQTTGWASGYECIDRYGRVDILVNNAATDDENGLDTIEKNSI